MPAMTGKSALLAKYGAKFNQAVAQHAADETDYGFIRLPGGITNGVAKLTKCYFDTYKPGSNQKQADGSAAVGEYYFRVEGTVVEPISLMTAQGEVQTQGLQTSRVLPLCGKGIKTSKGEVRSQEALVSEVLNEMRMLGGDEFTHGATGADLERLAAQLQEAGVYFKFTTSQSPVTPQYPNPRVFENWFGSRGLEGYVPPDLSGAMTDGSPSVEANGTGQSSETYEDPSNADGAMDDVPASVPDANAEGESPDLAALAVAANAGDAAAGEQLKAMALEVGLTEEYVDSEAKDWGEVAEKIQATLDGSGVEESATGVEPEPTPAIPAKGEIWKYVVHSNGKPTNGKDGKPLPPLTVEIIAVDATKRTAQVKDTKTKRILVGADKKPVHLAWDHLVAG